ncbi:MAG: hypothetical protein K1000chlam3_01736 [Chlamydiae bacterium]|nr:hypothetical protein [Chlamydiota bacterium]
MNTIVAFYPNVPHEITINRNWSCRPSEPENAWKKPYLAEPATVESVKNALDIGGPFAAIAALGPRRYTAEPIQFDNLIPNHPNVYGWMDGAQRTAEQFAQSIIICGAQRTQGKERIYYVLADDVSKNPEMAIGTYRTSTDNRVFVASVNTYNEHESDMFPPVSEEEIKNFSSQQVVPTILAGKPDLIEKWKQGEIRCERLPNGEWQVSRREPSQKIFVTYAK